MDKTLIEKLLVSLSSSPMSFQQSPAAIVKKAFSIHDEYIKECGRYAIKADTEHVEGEIKTHLLQKGDKQHMDTLKNYGRAITSTTSSILPGETEEDYMNRIMNR